MANGGLIMANEALLEIHRLTVVRSGRQLLDDLTFRVESGEVMALLGPNGAGKSTLLKSIAGLLPYSGSIQVQGIELKSFSPRNQALSIAYVPQHSALDAPLLVHEVVAQGRFAHQGLFPSPTSTDRHAIDQALQQSGAAHLADRAFTRLSYGERRLVLLARALATQAPILLLDEPTAALDVKHSLNILKVLQTVARSGRAVIVALHLLDEALRTSTCAVLLQQGRIAYQGATSEVIAPGPIANVFGVQLVPNQAFWYQAIPESHQ
jgi:iron complex transport system ATP-binding protein